MKTFLRNWNWMTTTTPPPERRLSALAVAVAGCALFSVVLGAGLWSWRAGLWRTWILKKTEVGETTPPLPAAARPAPPAATPTGENDGASPPGMVFVQGGEVIVGGTGGRPYRKTTVGDFYIAAAEVTRSQYFAFLQDTGGDPPPPAGNEQPEAPITNITWREAQAYCAWLGRRLGCTVRLPTEAEWNRAAAGERPRVYPWGDEWRPAAAACAESGGEIRPVKSFPDGRSVWGSYDMAGNVWEWTADRTSEGKVVIKGGAADEEREWLRIRAAQEVPLDTRDTHLGFRYLVETASPTTTTAASPRRP